MNNSTSNCNLIIHFFSQITGCNNPCFVINLLKNLKCNFVTLQNCSQCTFSCSLCILLQHTFFFSRCCLVKDVFDKHPSCPHQGCCGTCPAWIAWSPSCSRALCLCWSRASSCPTRRVWTGARMTLRPSSTPPGVSGQQVITWYSQSESGAQMND